MDANPTMIIVINMSDLSIRCRFESLNRIDESRAFAGSLCCGSFMSDGLQYKLFHDFVTDRRKFMISKSRETLSDQC